MSDDGIVTTMMALEKLSNVPFILHFNLENDFKRSQGIDMLKFTTSQKSLLCSHTIMQKSRNVMTFQKMNFISINLFIFENSFVLFYK